ncbi:MAG TPA: hypothetical protein VGH99_18775, partial [Pseudonocardia sp.]
TGIELTVLAAGWLLGGTVGVGTVLYAVAIGPLAQLFLPWMAYRPAPRPTVVPACAAAAPTPGPGVVCGEEPLAG